MRRGGSRCERDVFCTEDGLARAVRNLSHSGACAVAVAAEAPNVRPRCATYRGRAAGARAVGRRVTRGRVGRDAAPLSCPRWGAGAPWRRGPPASRPVTARLEWPSWARTSGRGAPSRTSSTAGVCRNPWRWTRRRSPALRADRSPCGGSSPGPVGLTSAPAGACGSVHRGQGAWDRQGSCASVGHVAPARGGRRRGEPVGRSALPATERPCQCLPIPGDPGKRTSKRGGLRLVDALPLAIRRGALGEWVT